MSAENYGDQFHGERIRHQEATRDIRQAAWDDTRLDDVERMVLGITGSRSILYAYESLIERIDGLLGQPVISIDGRTRDNGVIQKGRGGIIAGEMKIISSGFTNEARSHGRVGANLRLEIPVDPIVIYANGPIMPEMAIFTGNQVNGNTLLIGALANVEAHNETTNINKDFRQVYEPTTVLLGRRAIGQASEMFDGLLEVLEAIDNLDSSY